MKKNPWFAGRRTGLASLTFCTEAGICDGQTTMETNHGIIVWRLRQDFQTFRRIETRICDDYSPLTDEIASDVESRSRACCLVMSVMVLNTAPMKKRVRRSSLSRVTPWLLTSRLSYHDTGHDNEDRHRQQLTDRQTDRRTDGRGDLCQYVI